MQAVRARNQICILDIDMQGVKNIKKTDLNPIYISIHPPSVRILVRGGGGRCVMTTTVLQLQS